MEKAAAAEKRKQNYLEKQKSKLSEYQSKKAIDDLNKKRQE